MKREVFRIERATCKTQGITTLRNFSLSISEGEIVGIYPASYYAVPQLMELIVSNSHLYYGYVYYLGQEVNSWKRQAHTGNRIAIIGSRSTLIAGQDILTNIFIFRPGIRKVLVNRKILQKQLAPYLEELDMNLAPGDLVDTLSQLERIVVEILRAVVAGYHLIVIREVETGLREDELKNLHRLMTNYAGMGIAFLYISLHAEALKGVCDGFYIMKNGSNLMYYRKPYPSCLLSYRNDGDGIAAEKPAIFQQKAAVELSIGKKHFSIGRGTCTAVSYRHEKEYEITVESLYKGQAVLLQHGRVAAGTGKRLIAVITEKPEERMLFADMNCMDNLCISIGEHVPGIWSRRRIRENIIREVFRETSDIFLNTPVRELRLTEKLQLVYMRVLLQKPLLVICVQPFGGYDLAHRKVIEECLERLKKSSAAVMLLSKNMEDIKYYADYFMLV